MNRNYPQIISISQFTNIIYCYRLFPWQFIIISRSCTCNKEACEVMFWYSSQSQKHQAINAVKQSQLEHKALIMRKCEHNVFIIVTQLHTPSRTLSAWVLTASLDCLPFVMAIMQCSDKILTYYFLTLNPLLLKQYLYNVASLSTNIQIVNVFVKWYGTC